MIDVKLIKKPKNNRGNSGIATNGNGYNTGGVVKEAAHAAEADLAIYAKNAGNANEAEHAQEADHARTAFDLDSDSPIRDLFLSRQHDDTAKGLVTFLKGLVSQEVVKTTKAFQAGNYEPGASGGIFGMDAEGDSFAEVARLYVRVRAFFEELTIIKAGVLAGKQYITPGGGVKCTGVEETPGAWRCWFLSEQDGDRTKCGFEVGDQAIAQVFNAREGTSGKVSNRRYWRLVTAVVNDARADNNGNHYGYIDLSKIDCEAGSDVPVAGDEICQLGSRSDVTRQAAMVFSTVDADAPSMKLFSGINSFSLAGKAVVAFGRDAVTGKVFFRLGASGARQFLEYTQDYGLRVAGRISAESTYDDGKIGRAHV